MQFSRISNLLVFAFHVLLREKKTFCCLFICCVFPIDFGMAD